MNSRMSTKQTKAQPDKKTAENVINISAMKRSLWNDFSPHFQLGRPRYSEEVAWAVHAKVYMTDFFLFAR